MRVSATADGVEDNRIVAGRRPIQPLFRPFGIISIMRWLYAFVLLAAICATTFAQEPSITVTRGGRTQTMSLVGKSAEQCFHDLERAIEQFAQPGDRIHIVGTFVSGPLDMLDLANLAGGALTGAGPEKSRIIVKAQHDRIGPEDNPQKPGGPAIMLPNNGEIRLAGLYLENTPANIHEDGALAGWPGNTTGFSIATFEDCEVKAHDWGLVYDWSLRANRTVTLRRVKGVAARSFVNLMNSSASYTLLIEDCDIGIDGNLSQSWGASSGADPVTGGVLTPLILRAGTAHVKNCTFWIRGMNQPKGHSPKWMPTRIAAIATDQFYSRAAQTTRFHAENCRVKFVEPVNETVIYDLDFRFGQATVDDPSRSGSGPDGALRMWTGTFNQFPGG